MYVPLAIELSSVCVIWILVPAIAHTPMATIALFAPDAFAVVLTITVIALGCAIGEVTCPARYIPEASSINFRRSVRYGLGCLATAVRFRLARWGLVQPIV